MRLINTHTHSPLNHETFNVLDPPPHTQLFPVERCFNLNSFFYLRFDKLKLEKVGQFNEPKIINKYLMSLILTL